MCTIHQQRSKYSKIGVLDLRFVGYFKVNYQKMITMAESRQTFKIYHYQQVRKESKEHIDEYFRMSCTDSKGNQLAVARVILTNTLG